MSIDPGVLAEQVAQRLQRDRGTRDRAQGFVTQVTDVPGAIVGANHQRTKLIIVNESASDIELGDRSLRFGEGITVAANGGSYIDDVAPFLGEWWAVGAAAGPLDVRVRDES